MRNRTDINDAGLGLVPIGWLFALLIDAANTDSIPISTFLVAIGVSALLALPVAYFWRTRFEYRGATITRYSTFSRSRRYVLGELHQSRFAGQRFEANNGDSFAVSSLLRGHKDFLSYLRAGGPEHNHIIGSDRE